MSYRDVSRYRKAYKKNRVPYHYSDYNDGGDDLLFEPVEEVEVEDWPTDVPIFEPQEESELLGPTTDMYDYLLDASAPPLPNYTQNRNILTTNVPQNQLTREDLEMLGDVYREFSKKDRPENPAISAGRFVAGAYSGDPGQTIQGGVGLVRNVGEFIDYMDRPYNLQPTHLSENVIEKVKTKRKTRDEEEGGINPDGSYNYGSYSSYAEPDRNNYFLIDGVWTHKNELTDAHYTPGGIYKTKKGTSNWQDVASTLSLIPQEQILFNPNRRDSEEEVLYVHPYQHPDGRIDYNSHENESHYGIYSDDNKLNLQSNMLRLPKESYATGKLTNSQGKIIFTGKDYVQDIISSTSSILITTGSSQNIYELPINPGLINSGFTYLCNIAQQFQYYKFLELEYIYVPACGDSTSSDGNNSIGKVVMAYDVDPNAPNFVSVPQLLNDYSAISFPPTQSQSIKVKVGRDYKLFIRSSTITGEEQTNVDLRNSDAGNFYIATIGCPSETTIGQLYVKYTVELYQSVLTGYSLGQNHLFSLRKLQSRSGTFDTYFPGTASGVSGYGGDLIYESLPLTFPNAGTCKFPLNVTGCVFDFYWQYSFGTFTTSSLTVSSTGITLLDHVQQGSTILKGINTRWQVNGATATINLHVICRIDSSNALLTLTGGTFGTPYSGGTLMVNQLPSSFTGFENAT